MDDMRNDVREIRGNVHAILVAVTEHGVHLETAKDDIKVAKNDIKKLQGQMIKAIAPVTVLTYMVKTCAGMSAIAAVCFGLFKGAVALYALWIVR